MNLYLIKQSKNKGYDTYDSAVVAAETEEIAKTIHPDNDRFLPLDEKLEYCYWVLSVEDVKVEYIGVAAEGIKQGVICASFNAG